VSLHCFKTTDFEVIQSFRFKFVTSKWIVSLHRFKVADFKAIQYFLKTSLLPFALCKPNSEIMASWTLSLPLHILTTSNTLIQLLLALPQSLLALSWLLLAFSRPLLAFSGHSHSLFISFSGLCKHSQALKTDRYRQRRRAQHTAPMRAAHLPPFAF
jgi:hypothetical protein